MRGKRFVVSNYFNTHRIKNALEVVKQIVDMPSAKRHIFAIFPPFVNRPFA